MIQSIPTLVQPKALVPTKTAGPAPTIAQAQPKFGANTVTMTGNGFVFKNPDVATISVGVQEKGADRAAVLQAVTAKAEAITAAVKEISPDFKLQSSGVRVTPNNYYNQETGKQEQDGFVGNFTLSIKEKSADLDALKAHAAKVNEVTINNGGNFYGAAGSLSERRSAAGAREALSMAYKDAFQKANKVAKTAGFALDPKPVEVVENGIEQSYGAPKGRARAAGYAMLAAAAPEGAMDGGVSEDLIQFAPIRIDAPTITVHFQLGEAPKAEGGLNVTA
jgi:uncharacterized protein YggE